MAEGVTEVVVLGGGFAGVLASKRIAKAVGERVKVTLVSKSDAFVERVRFHEIAAARETKRWPFEALTAPAGVSFVLGTATRLDPDAKRVHLTTPRGKAIALWYDKLVYALGSGIDLDAVPGVREHAHSVTDEAASRRLAGVISTLGEGGRVVIVGGGMTGIDVASEIAEMHPRVRVRVVTMDRPCEPLSSGARAHLVKALARMRVEVRTGARVRAVDAGAVHVEGERDEPFDVCVWAASFKAPELARESGLAVHPKGQLEVDDVLRSTSHPDVYGAGDAALPTSSVGIRMGCATAMPMGAHASDNLVAELLDKPLEPWRFAYLARFISLGRKDGIGQFTKSDDAPRAAHVTGLMAVWLKEWTFDFNAFGLETGFYPWKLALPRRPSTG